MGDNFKGFKKLEHVESDIISALFKLILNGEEVKLTGTLEDGQVLMRVLDGATHYWTNRTPGYPDGPDISNKADKTTTLTGTSPIRINGGNSGDLSANRTISILESTPELAGSMSASDKVKLDAIIGDNTGDQNASEVPITDALDLFIAENVEDALAELAGKIMVQGNPYKMSMPAGNISTKVAGATFSPAGWGTVAQSGDYNIIVTSVLTGRKARFVNVFEVDGGNEQLLSFERGQSYSAMKNNGLTTLLEGFAPTTLPVEVLFIFD